MTRRAAPWARAGLLLAGLVAAVAAAAGADGPAQDPAAGAPSPPPSAAPAADTGAVGALLAFAALLAFPDVDTARRWALSLLHALWALAQAGAPAALFSRIAGQRILDNPVRQRIHTVIQQDPGVCMGDVQERAGVAWGTIVHHLHRLERHGLVVSQRQGASRRYFAANTPAARGPEAMVLRHPTVHRIAHYVHAHPGINQAGVCRDLGLQNPAASKHLGHLESLGLITAQRAGRHRLYRATQALASALEAIPRKEG